MNKKLLMGLALVALVVVGAAVWLSGQRKAQTGVTAGGALVPGLEEQINEIGRIVVDDGASQVELKLAPEGWIVMQQNGFAADLSQLRRRLLALADALRLEKKTANAERYGQLGVSDVSADDGDDQNRQVTIEGLASPVTLIIGKRASGGGNTYVRIAGEQQSWLASGDLSFSAKPADWIRKDLLDIGASRIRKVTLTHQDGPEIALEKATADLPNFAVANLPEGRELVSPSAGNSIASALSSLRIDAVLPADKADFQGVDIVQGQFETFDGLRIDTRSWEKGDKRFVILAVAFDPALVASVPAAADTGDSEAAEASGDSAAVVPAADADDTAAAAAEAREEAEALAALVSGWAFEIPSYKYSNLSKNLEDLLKPLETEAEDE